MATQHAVLFGARVDIQGDRLQISAPLIPANNDVTVGNLVQATELAPATLGSAGIGQGALSNITTGKGDLAVGNLSGLLITTGSRDVLFGPNTGASLTTQNDNTFVGNDCGQNCVSGQNTGEGSGCIASLTTGNAVTAVGYNAGNKQSTASGGCYFGKGAGQNDIAADNCYYGLGAGQANANSGGSGNCGYGYTSLGAATNSLQNTGYGYNSLGSLLTGNANAAFHFGAGSAYTGSESGNLCLYNNGTIGESNAIHIGQASHTTASLAGVSGSTSASGVAVLVNASGVLGTTTSNRSKKTNIQDLEEDVAMDVIENFPIKRFNWIKESDGTQRQLGTIHEDLEEVAHKAGMPELIADKKHVNNHFVPFLAIAGLKNLKRRLEKLEEEHTGGKKLQRQDSKEKK
jgi:hypothetical protein